MQKLRIKNSLVIALAIFSFSIALPSVAIAMPVKTSEAQAAAEEKQSTVADKKAEAQTRLAETKLKVCQKREKTITNIMTRISNRGQRQINLFDKIAERTKTFYTNKGKTLSNYDTLVNNVSAKKADAQAAVDATKATSATFSCDGTDPKGVAATFKEKMKAQNDALKAYKTAVKDLIVGVKSVQSTTRDKASTGGNQ